MFLLLWSLTDDSGDDFSPSSPPQAPGQGGGSQNTEVQSALRTLGSKVEDLSTCNDLISKHGSALQRSGFTCLMLSCCFTFLSLQAWFRVSHVSSILTWNNSAQTYEHLRKEMHICHFFWKILWRSFCCDMKLMIFSPNYLTLLNVLILFQIFIRTGQFASDWRGRGQDSPGDRESHTVPHHL